LCEFLGIRPRSGPPVGKAKEKPLMLTDPIIEGVIAYVHWLVSRSRDVVTGKVAGSDGFIPSFDEIDEVFSHRGASFHSE
jgi:hypothetical protein